MTATNLEERASLQESVIRANTATIRQLQVALAEARTEIVLLKSGRYARVTHKLTTASGEKIVRIHYWKGCPATVPASHVVAVWKL
jgi:hypothetical protein